MSQKELNDRKHKWVSKVQDFDFDIEYKKVKFNVVADALSSKPTHVLMKIHDDWKTQLAIKYSKNQFECELLDGMIHNYDYKILNDVIY